VGTIITSIKETELDSGWENEHSTLHEYFRLYKNSESKPKQVALNTLIYLINKLHDKGILSNEDVADILPFHSNHKLEVNNDDD